MSETTIRRRILTALGYKVLSDINAVSVVMPTALVGTVLLTLRGRGVGKAELVRRVEWLSERVRAQGGRVAHFAGNTTETVVDRALDVLGPKLVGRVMGLPEQTFFAEDRFQLSFYRNMTIHLFVSQALVCAALYTKVKLGGSAESQRIAFVEMRDYVFFLSRLFRGIFIFPTTPFEDNLQATVQGLERDGVIATERNNVVSNEIEIVDLHPDERSSGRENFDFYNFLIWPFIEASWLGSISLFMLTRPVEASESGVWVDLKTFQDSAQLLGKTLYHQGDLSYFEAVNKETLKDTFNRSEEEGIIVVTRSKDSKTSPKVRLGEEWIPERDSRGKLSPEGKLWDLCERISQSRREGKNRRDGATVRTRVLGLVELVGGGLFQTAVTEADGEPKKSRRRKGIQTTSRL